MTDIEKIVWGALGGVIVYVIGQIVSKFLIEPLYELRKTVGEIRFNLSFHAPTINTPISRTQEKSDSARDALLKNSCDLLAKLHAVPCYPCARFFSFGALPEGKAIEDAAIQLRNLSTYMHEKGERANNTIESIITNIADIERKLRLTPLK